MAAELDPEAVARRLDRLRQLWQPLTEHEARQRMEASQRRAESFSDGVRRRLEELRALSDLTRRLQQRGGGSRR